VKPLTHCPHCQAVLVKKTIPEHLNRMKYENCSERCVVDYFQYFKQSYDELEVDYITYNTPDDKFHIYTYFNHGMYQYFSHIYANETTKKYGKSSPILTLPWDKYPLDVTNLKAVNEKISTLSLFV
jgi:hypothetical protein